jgi:phosphinothricin acetyltransferase
LKIESGRFKKSPSNFYDLPRHQKSSYCRRRFSEHGYRIIYWGLSGGLDISLYDGQSGFCLLIFKKLKYYQVLEDRMGTACDLIWSFSETKFSGADCEDINALLAQLSPSARRVTSDKLRQLLAQSNYYILAARSPKGRVVGIATIVIYEKLTGKVGIIEDVVVDKDHRGLGLGKSLVQYLIKFAQAKNVEYLDLTSNPSRKEANELYLKLGFKKRETNCYRLHFRGCS